MSGRKRVVYFITGLFMVLFGVIMMFPSEEGYKTVLNILEFALIISGIKHLHFYFTMARYMVGGIYIFFKGIFILDAGLFAFNLDDVPKQYAMLYLIGGLAIAGVIGIMHAMEVRKLESGKWKSLLAQGIIQISVAIVCLFFLGDQDMLTLVYGLGLLHSGIMRIMTSFRKTAIVYVK
ncbi:MAG: DUF308 domain-containing protein [Lachnospiraceae bacterium]|nr:DUF308 domain-containing protein [Lachnospiraceae bacterium]